MTEFLMAPWPWYVAGPIIGLVVPLLLILGNKQFAISSTLRDFCAFAIPNNLTYFKYDLKDVIWRNVFVIGVLLGGVFMTLLLDNNQITGISNKTIEDLSLLGITDFEGLVPNEIFTLSNIFSLKGFVFMIVGGFLVGFGTRYADGCTSGHAIMGMSLFSKSAMVAVVGFFVGGLFATHFLFKLIF